MTTPASGKDERKLQIAQDLLALPIGADKPLQWDMDVLVEYIATSNQQAVQKALEGRIDWLDDQMRHILYDIYPEDVFTPPTEEDYARINEFDGNLHTRLHCDGIRHGLHILRREVRGLSAREDLPKLATTQPQKERKDGDDEN